MIGGEQFLAFALLLLSGGGGSTAPSSPRAPSPRPAPQLPPPVAFPASTAPPWPQVVPSGLPAFPGSGWEYDEPPPLVVQQRAGQLLSQLWAGGSGTFKIEQTAGRWIAYRAEIVKSGKQGVVAYRQKLAAAPKPPATAATPKPAPKTASTAPSRPVVTSQSPGLPQPPRAPAAPAPAPAPVSIPAPVAMPSVVNPPTPPNIAALPDRKYGDGMKPKPSDPYVLLAQQKLAALGFQPGTLDGRFGNDTRNAAIAFQVRAGLAPADQTPEQLKARGFGAVKQATWKKLFEARA